MERVKSYIIPVLKSYSAILFNSNVAAGFILLLLTFLVPSIGIGGFVAVISAYLFAISIGFKNEFVKLDYFIFNPLLVGLSLGFLFKVNLLSILFFSIAGILTFLFTYALANIYHYYAGLPILSIPFVIVSSALYLASSKFSTLFVTGLYPHYFSQLSINLPLTLQGYFISLGAIFFLPYPLIGMIIAVLLFFVSRIIFLLSILGYFSGVLTKVLFSGSFYESFSDPSAFNYILIAIAIGGVFLIPSRKSYRFAVLTSIIAVPVVEGAKVFWETYGVPVFAFPFNIITHVLLYVLFTSGYAKVVRYYKGTPEKTLDYYHTISKRFPGVRGIFPPFSGEWVVWQGFDGEWTHKGAWKYALDFVVVDKNNNTYRDNGEKLEDYYAFGKPILSPIDGYVVDVIDNIPDNPPGEANKANNWGNYVLLYDEKKQFYILISHFKKNSVKVMKGDPVSIGKVLGQCGNSGYSPQPHIHIQVQLSPVIGAPTVPFTLVSYLSGEKDFVDQGVPEKGDKVEKVVSDKMLYNKLNFLIGEQMRFKITGIRNNGEFDVEVKMAADGTFYLTDGKAKLYFGVINSTFYFYSIDGDLNSPLKYLLIGAPKIPLICRDNLSWSDFLPTMAISSKFKRELTLFLSSFAESISEIKVKGHCNNNRYEFTTSGKITKKSIVELSDEKGLEKIILDDHIVIEKIDR